jgi:hypothetical protein
MRLRRALVLVLAVAWVLLGPIATAFDHCGAMTGDCGASCGPVTGVMTPHVPAAALMSAASAAPAALISGTFRTLDALEPPPRAPFLA